MRKTASIIIMIAFAATCHAQTSSTVCNADGTVTFLYKNDNAKEVQTDVQFAGRHAMSKDPKTGLWTVTLGPAVPDIYPYCFIVDGLSVMDPLCPGYFPNEGFKNSLLEIPGKNLLIHDRKDVRHGSVEYINYYSQSLGATNQAIVYLPPSYGKPSSKEKYPVFYLISGTTDTEEVYYKVGRVNYILDNLIAEGAAKEMIVVLPYGNPTKLLPAPAEGSAPRMGFGRDVFSLDLINDLMPYIEKNYRTIADRDHRAIGGFSRGGNQALLNGLSNIDKFSYLCSYSSFTITQIPNVYDNAADTNSKLHLFWLGIGTDDFLYGTSRDYLEFLDSKGIRTVKEFTTGKFGHTWMNARYFLDKTLRLLFNPEASEKAMQQGTPAPAATGEEKPFTPGVMASLFPRQVVSPEYSYDHITFRLKAPEASKVTVEVEGLKNSLNMTKDADGVWSQQLNDDNFDITRPFKYCFVVDGTKIADPTNMNLSPDKGFKYSVSIHTAGAYNMSTMGETINHGKVSYDIQRQEAWYMPPVEDKNTKMVTIQLVPGKDDTIESWFKAGGVNAVADKLISEKRTKPCILTTSSLKYQDSNHYILKADDYKTWAERQKALEDLLLKLK